MFEIGEYIVYGNTGVCKVAEKTKMAAPGAKTDKLYYTLEPVYDKGCRLFTPVDNQKVKMRPVLTKKEADELIGKIKEYSAYASEAFGYSPRQRRFDGGGGRPRLQKEQRADL